MATDYLKHAETCRRIAASLKHPKNKEAFIKKAQRYEELAKK